MHQKVDHDRDLTAKRQARDKTPKRRKMHQDVDHKRYQEEDRKYYINLENGIQSQREEVPILNI